jgi:hypothetical protein
MHASGMPIHRLKSDVTLLFLLSCGDLTRVQLFLSFRKRSNASSTRTTVR